MSLCLHGFEQVVEVPVFAVYSHMESSAGKPSAVVVFHVPHFDCFISLENGSFIVQPSSRWLLEHFVEYPSTTFDGLF
jgi:hypothetical protein